MTFDEAAVTIRAARHPADLFTTGDLKVAQKRFQELARACHPDRVPPEHRDTATAVMADLTSLYMQLTKPPTARPALLGKWLVTGQLAKGALSDLYSVRSVKDDTTGVLKIVRHPRDNQLLAREVLALETLAKDDRGVRFQRYIPKVLDKFEASYRRVTVLSDVVTVSLTLEQIRKSYPTGIPFRHVVWMMNRLLSVLGFTHHNDLIHGAVLPQHLIYHPANHGLTLIDWSCSCLESKGQTIPYTVTRYKDHYPVEVLFSKGRAVQSTDVYMAFAAMRFAAGGMSKVPHRFRGLFEWALLESCNSRAQYPWAVQDKWVKLAEEEYGKPQFVEFEIPTN